MNREPLINYFRPVLRQIVLDPQLHAKWLNTLSYLENCGARKIASCEHPTRVKEEMLKHASEEFRHAHYLKKQIKKLIDTPLTDYSPSSILGGFTTFHYLNTLDIAVCRHLKQEKKLSKEALKGVAYILVTYAIELRASELYPLYHEILKESSSKVAVKSILLEEEEHLEEMKMELEEIPDGKNLLLFACQQEKRLCRNWLTQLIQREQ